MFLIKQLEESYLDMNKTITLLRRKQVGFHADLDDMVRKICQLHQDEATGYNRVKAHVAEQNHQLKAKQKAPKNVIQQPPLKKVSVEKVVDEQFEHKDPDSVIQDEAANEDLPPPPPEPTTPVDDLSSIMFIERYSCALPYETS